MPNENKERSDAHAALIPPPDIHVEELQRQIEESPPPAVEQRREPEPIHEPSAAPPAPKPSLWEGLHTLVLRGAAVATVLIFAALIAVNVFTRSIDIEPISVPPSLVNQGYDPVVFAHSLRDALNATAAKSQERIYDISFAGDTTDINVPAIGMSVATIAGGIRDFLHIKTHRQISGEVVSETGGKISLHLRLDHKKIFSSPQSVPQDGPLDLLEGASTAVFQQLMPYVVASAAYEDKESADNAKAFNLASEIIAGRRPGDPNVYWAHVLRGIIYDSNGDEHKAEAEYRAAIALPPDRAPAHANLGTLLGELNKNQEAEKEYLAAIGLDPRDAMTRVNFGQLLDSEKRTADAVEQFRKAVELDPGNATAHCNLGKVLQDQGKLDEAETEYRKAIDLQQHYALAHNNLGALLQARGETAKAESEYAEAVKADPDLAVAHYNLGALLPRLGKKPEGEAETRKAAKLDPSL
jgi:Tfp pilus assembly protein PilF